MEKNKKKIKKVLVILLITIPLLMVSLSVFASGNLYGHIDQDHCINCEMCCTILPEVFKQDGGGVTIKVNPIPNEHITAFLECIKACPTSAISLIGGQ